MTPLLLLGDEIASLIAASGAILLTALVLRNRLAPKWLRTEAVAQAASLILVAVLMFGTAELIQSLIAVGLTYVQTGVVTIAVTAGSIYALWKTFSVGERLEIADSGRSPFGPIERGQFKPEFALQTH